MGENVSRTRAILENVAQAMSEKLDRETYHVTIGVESDSNGLHPEIVIRNADGKNPYKVAVVFPSHYAGTYDGLRFQTKARSRARARNTLYKRLRFKTEGDDTDSLTRGLVGLAPKVLLGLYKYMDDDQRESRLYDNKQGARRERCRRWVTFLRSFEGVEVEEPYIPTLSSMSPSITFWVTGAGRNFVAKVIDQDHLVLDVRADLDAADHPEGLRRKMKKLIDFLED